MKINHIIYMAGLVAMLAACSSDDVLQQTEGSRVPIGLSYTTQPQADTRAAASTTLNNDYIEVGKKVKVRISNHGTDDWKEYTYTTGENGALALPTTPKYAETDADGVPYYPLNAETHVDIKAYYPADAVSSGSSSFSIRTDQTDDDAYTASDLMWAEPLEDKEKTTSNQTLTFSHKMAKIIVNVAAGTAVSQINSVTLKNIKPTVTFNKGTGVINALTGEAGDVKIVKQETATNVSGTAVIPEQAIDGQLLAVGVTLNDNTTTGTAYYMVNKTFTAGNVYTLNITVSYPEVEAETAITDWLANGSAYVNSFFDIADITTPFTYDGSAKEPALTVKHNGTTLVAGTDYTVSYENNVNAGTAAAMVTGIGKYVGATGAKTFTISKAPGSISYASSSVSRNFEDGLYTHPLTLTGDGTVTYTSSNTSVATVNSKTGEVRIVGIGTPTITATVADGENYTYDSNTATYTLTTSVTFQGIAVGNLIYQSGVWSPMYDAALGTPVAIVFTNYTTSYDSNLGWTHGYAMALKDYNNGEAIANWCNNVSSLQTTAITGDLIPCTLNNIQADLNGLKHCNTANTYCTSKSIALSNLTAIYAAMVGFESQVSAPENTSGWYLPSIGQQYAWLRASLPNVFTGFETWSNGLRNNVVTHLFMPNATYDQSINAWLSSKGLSSSSQYTEFTRNGYFRHVSSSEFPSNNWIYTLQISSNTIYFDADSDDNIKSYTGYKVRSVFAF